VPGLVAFYDIRPGDGVGLFLAPEPTRGRRQERYGVLESPIAGFMATGSGLFRTLTQLALHVDNLYTRGLTFATYLTVFSKPTKAASNI